MPRKTSLELPVDKKHCQTPAEKVLEGANLKDGDVVQFSAREEVKKRELAKVVPAWDKLKSTLDGPDELAHVASTIDINAVNRAIGLAARMIHLDILLNTKGLTTKELADLASNVVRVYEGSNLHQLWKLDEDQTKLPTSQAAINDELKATQAKIEEMAKMFQRTADNPEDAPEILAQTVQSVEDDVNVN